MLVKAGILRTGPKASILMYATNRKLLDKREWSTVSTRARAPSAGLASHPVNFQLLFSEYYEFGHTTQVAYRFIFIFLF